MVRSRYIILSACIAALVLSTHGAWQDISSDLVNSLKSQGLEIPFPGGGGVAGVAVNRFTGAVFIQVQGQGIWKSTDEGGSWTRIDNNTVSGRGEMGWAIDQDEANPDRMAVFSLDGLAGYTADGTTWQSYDNMGRNWDFGSVDWSVPEANTALATQHEAGGNVYLTTDGKTWSLLNVKVVASGGVDASVIAMVGVLDATTLIYCKGDGIHRSTDVGATWSQVSAVNVRTRTPVKYKGVVYLGGMGGLLVSRDNGATWETQGGSIEIQQGPFFGGDNENTMVIVNPSGFYQTTDGAESWTKLPVSWPQPEGEYDCRGIAHFAWDSKNNNLYASRMAQPALMWKMGPPTAVQKESVAAPNADISIAHSTIRSGAPMNGVQVYSLSGKLIHRQSVARAKSVVLPAFVTASGSMLIVKVSTANGDASTRLWR